MTAAIISYPTKRVVRERWYYGSVSGLHSDNPDREELEEAARSIFAATAALNSQWRSVTTRLWAIYRRGEDYRPRKSRAGWDRARKRDLGEFILKMMRKYGRSPDEAARQELLDWLDRLQATVRVAADDEGTAA
jgi:hypothetical protein